MSLTGFPGLLSAQEQQTARIGDFKLESGEVIRDCAIGYRTFGTLNPEKSNAVLFPTAFGWRIGWNWQPHRRGQTGGDAPQWSPMPQTRDGTRLTPAEQQEIVNFEMGLSTAQTFGYRTGFLNAQGANGGPIPLVNQPFFISINSSIHFLLPQFEQPGGLVTQGDGQFTSSIFDTFDAWAGLPNGDPRAAVARGQAIFNSKPINITGVAGINDDISAGGLVAGGIPSLQGTCGTCHDTPNVGNHSFPTPLNIGTGDPSPSSPSANMGGLDITYLPSITVCETDPATGSPTSNCKTTTDLGQALIMLPLPHACERSELCVHPLRALIVAIR